MRWSALAAARHAAIARVPWLIAGMRVGSVDRRHLPALAPYRDTLIVADDQVALHPALADAADRTAALVPINRALRDAGLIAAWRDETYAIVSRHGAEPLALIERAAARFWGTLTFGAHCNGYLADGSGRPTHLWIARRALTKGTDPGKLDNLVGGGVPHGQTPFETLLREGFEEAGLDAQTMRRATPGRVIELARDIQEGFMHELLYTFDLRLPADMTPVNQDGEVAELRLLPVDEALTLAAGDTMTVDAALVTLDFALRHQLCSAADREHLSARLAPLLSTP
jgi:8-oxo-dGTP pyrophosphatase MutT (NUDIX family)